MLWEEGSREASPYPDYITEMMEETAEMPKSRGKRAILLCLCLMVGYLGSYGGLRCGGIITACPRIMRPGMRTNIRGPVVTVVVREEIRVEGLSDTPSVILFGAFGPAIALETVFRGLPRERELVQKGVAIYSDPPEKKEKM